MWTWLDGSDSDGLINECAAEVPRRVRLEAQRSVFAVGQPGYTLTDDSGCLRNPQNRARVLASSFRPFYRAFCQMGRAAWGYLFRLALRCCRSMLQRPFLRSDTNPLRHTFVKWSLARPYLATMTVQNGRCPCTAMRIGCELIFALSCPQRCPPPGPWMGSRPDT